MVYIISNLFRHIEEFHIRKVTGLENIPRDAPCIIAANHNSFIDPFVLGTTVTKHVRNKKMYFISEMLLIWDFLINLIFRDIVNTLRINRKVRGSVVELALKKLKEGHILIIFPEGIINNKLELRKGKTGVARLALKGKVPVIPVGIKTNCYPWSVFSVLRWMLKQKKKSKIKIGKPLYFKKYYGRDENYVVLRRVTTIIMKKVGLLLGRKYNF